MVCGQREGPARTWPLGDVLLHETETYKYLGWTLKRNGQWMFHLNNAISTTMGKVERLAGMGLVGRSVPLSVSRVLLESMALSSLERGCELMPLACRPHITMA